MKIKSYNPANNELLGEVEETSLNEIENIYKKSKEASKIWGYLTLKDRISYIEKLYNIIKNKKQAFAELITNEVGMPISESLYDVDSGLEHIDKLKMLLKKEQKLFVVEKD